MQRNAPAPFHFASRCRQAERYKLHSANRIDCNVLARDDTLINTLGIHIL